jgi:hypothetical protein
MAYDRERMKRELKLQMIYDMITKTYITKDDLDLSIKEAYELILNRIVEDRGGDYKCQ